jgi:GntR family transcriptional regulator
MAGADAVDHAGGPPLYQQVAEILRKRIMSGEIPPGRMLPSETQLERQYGVARKTIRRALIILREEEGLIETNVGRGSHVIDPLPD